MIQQLSQKVACIAFSYYGSSKKIAFLFYSPHYLMLLSEFRGDVTHIHHSETPFQKLITAQHLLYQYTAHHQVSEQRTRFHSLHPCLRVLMMVNQVTSQQQTPPLGGTSCLY